jgi:predicted RNA-binding Zn-ribbon protein involved in translation (DUF1610 family)
MQYPLCGACHVDLDMPDDYFQCPSCGTVWDLDAMDETEGQLYEQHSGEEPGGPAVSADDAWRWGKYVDEKRRHRLLPDLAPEPKRPEL